MQKANKNLKSFGLETNRKTEEGSADSGSVYMAPGPSLVAPGSTPGKLKKGLKCPQCGEEMFIWRNPTPTVDILIHCRTPQNEEGIVLILRKNEPRKWAIPGGFVDYGESVEEAAVREAREETSLDVRLLRQFHCYSDPHRDPRRHNLSVVFLAEAGGIPKAADDAVDIGLFAGDTLPDDLAFDHRQIMEDYFLKKY